MITGTSHMIKILIIYPTSKVDMLIYTSLVSFIFNLGFIKILK